MDTVLTYGKNGHRYSLTLLGDKSAVYEQLYDGITVGYEVFLLKESKPRERFGKFYPAKMRIPGNEDSANGHGVTAR